MSWSKAGYRIRDILIGPDPALFGSGFQDVNKNEFFSQVFLVISYWRYINISLQR
jgi:hypothetical protein